MSRISVIIPCYQHASTIIQCLNRIFAQTRLPDEVIVVNDGSTDGLSEVLKPYREEKRITYIEQDNRGGGAARNKGFDLSTGELVLFADADLIMEKNMLAELESALLKHPECAYAYCGFRFGWKTFISFPFSADRLRKMNYIQTGALIRREAFPRFDESLRRFQDWDLWLTILSRGGQGVYVPRILFHAMQKSGRTPISSWKPSLYYRLPWRWIGWKPKGLKKFEEAREALLRKHKIWM